MTLRVGIALLLALIFIGIAYRLMIYFNGMQVTSWWRSFWHNAEVGGVKASLHQVGLAFDVVPVSAENVSKLSALGLRVINEGDHLHAQVSV
jgi:uncharacterized protein YcbK (DUF882 family)